MLGLFTKKGAAAKVELKKIENRDLMQAIVGSMILLAFADGSCEKEELDTIEKLIAANENLAHFGSEITATMSRYIELMEAGERLGEIKIMREIADIKNSQQEAEEVFVCAITVAEARQPIEEKELKMLAKIGKELGLRVQDYGIEAA